MRLDLFLRTTYPEHTRAFWQRCVREGRVSVNGKIVRKVHAEISGSEKIDVQELAEEPQVPSTSRVAAPLPFKIIFEDAAVVVIDKPAGIAVHQPAPGETITELLVRGRDFVKPVHRLDKDTSGILVLAKSPAVHACLSEQWKERSVKKQYIALVKGQFDVVAGIIEASILRSFKDRKKMAVSSRTGARVSVTEFKVKKTFGAARGAICSELLVMPQTGRTHQIRVHMASIGHPVLGDSVYGDLKLNKKFMQEFGLQRQFLHASQLSFSHPITKKRLTFKTPLPLDLRRVLAALQRLN